MVNIYEINFLNLFNSYTKYIIVYILNVFWFIYQFGYGPKIIGKTQPTFDLLNEDA